MTKKKVDITKNMPNMVGNNLPVVAYVDPSMFMEIEAMRGDVPRSRFVGRIIQKSIKEAC